MPYDAQQIARELDETALGQAHHGNALRVAKDMPGVTDDDRAALDRFATGAPAVMDHLRLQDIAVKLRNGGKPRALLLLACSGMKLATPAPALELYRGVMYQTYRANVRPGAEPHVVILSALHGFVAPDAVIAPYDQRMTAARADEMLKHLMTRYMVNAGWPRELGEVFLAGGADYRRVMRAAIETMRHVYGREAAKITETHGAIGMQRAQLGAFLRAL